MTRRTSLSILFVLASSAAACGDDGAAGDDSTTSTTSGTASDPTSSAASTEGGTTAGPTTEGTSPTSASEATTSADDTGTTASGEDESSTSTGEVAVCDDDLGTNVVRFAHLDPAAGDLEVCLVRSSGCVDGPLFAMNPLAYGDVRATTQAVEAQSTVQWVEAGAADCESATVVLEQVVDLTGDPPTLMASPATAEPVLLRPLPEALDEGRVYGVLFHGATAPGTLTVAPDGDCTMLNPFFTAWDGVEPGTIGISPNGDVPYFNSSPPVEDFAIMVCSGPDKLFSTSLTLVPGEVSSFFFHGDGDAAPYGLVQCDDTGSGACSSL
ncbi:MAG: hypothetical protein AAGA54_26070 [Myxococcota bacterium]